MKDLLVLTADKNMTTTLENLLSRTKSFGIKEILYDVYSHRYHDPGVLRDGDKFLIQFIHLYQYALVVFDRKGCGRESTTTDELRNELQRKLNHTGWKDRSGVIVLDPELEAWVWSDSIHVSRVLGIQYKELKEILGKCPPGKLKPDNPKELFESILRKSRIPRSSSLYAHLARNVGFQHCTDGAFHQLKSLLHEWFGKEQSPHSSIS